MNTNTQPSEHAMRAAHAIFEEQADVLRTYEIIDQHAVAPAVAERDKRIAELERYVSELEDVCDSIQLKKAQHAAKHGASHE